ncbi:uncharacterized protein LOC134256103 [Saccostrea cucullata]|uniref:uncharacterized protein LOC134256103 n=1 Tax=Saccostrea cuccullata TaxID=36930 RepID=UPI002ED460CA
MGLFHSCMRKNKVGIISDEEEAAYKQIEKVNSEDVKEEVYTPTLLDAMFSVTPNQVYCDTTNSSSPSDCRPHSPDNSRSDVSQESEMTQPTYVSSVPKLPPINGNITRILILPIDNEAAYQEWKEKTHRALREEGLLKENKLAERRRKLIERGKLKN